MQKEYLTSMPPIISDNATLLILGSMPGAESLRLQEYYAYPRNFFWQILYTLIRVDRDPWSDSYEQRTDTLCDHGVALWDSLRSCKREGSLDQRIKEQHPNDILGLLEGYKSISTIFCNGGASYKYFYSYAKDHLRKVSDDHAILFDTIDVYKMPSTSPVPSKNYRNLEDRLVVWNSRFPVG